MKQQVIINRKTYASGVEQITIDLYAKAKVTLNTDPASDFFLRLNIESTEEREDIDIELTQQEAKMLGQQLILFAEKVKEF